MPFSEPKQLSEKSFYTLYFYNRWAKQVHFTNDVTQGRDYSINGAAAPVGAGYVGEIADYELWIGSERKLQL